MRAGAAAHLIVGARDEPFLPSLLESLSGAADALIVNDNSPGTSPHEDVLRSSWFGQHDRLFVDRAPFVDFSNARNRCLDVHRKLFAGEWAAFVDADEVHGSAVARVAANLQSVPPDADFIDGYTWHFFQSFDLYTSIERRMAFFRVKPGVRWEGKVHEQLRGLDGTRIALPYVYGHYGHVLPARRHAEKGRQYSALGQAGAIVEEEQLDKLDPAQYFAALWPRTLHFSGEHPPAARAAIAVLQKRYAPELERAEVLARDAQPAPVRFRNLLRKLNYEQRWRLRALDPRARSLLR